jgi:uncharacterized metal-binding protein
MENNNSIFSTWKETTPFSRCNVHVGKLSIWASGPVSNIIYVNFIIIYSNVRNPDPLYNIIHVNVIIIYSNVRNPGPVYNIIYVNVIIIYSDVRNPGAK